MTDTEIVDWLERWHDAPGKQHGYGDVGVALIVRSSDGWKLDDEYGGGEFDTFREAVLAGAMATSND